jgi:hypothetical protein
MPRHKHGMWMGVRKRLNVKVLVLFPVKPVCVMITSVSVTIRPWPNPSQHERGTTEKFRATREAPHCFS